MGGACCIPQNARETDLRDKKEDKKGNTDRLIRNGCHMDIKYCHIGHNETDMAMHLELVSFVLHWPNKTAKWVFLKSWS